MLINDVLLLNLVLVFSIMLFSSIIHSSTGFGFSVFAMTILPMFLPLILSAAIVKIALLVITILMVVSLRKHINYRFIILPTIVSLIGASVGFYLLMTINSGFLKQVLGGLLTLLGIYMFLFNGRVKIQKSVLASIGMGLLSGLMGGLFNLSGVVLVIYYFSVCDDKYEYVASLQATFTITAAYGVILNAVYGNFSPAGVPALAAVTVLAVLLGCFIGLKVLKIINKKVIGRLSYSYMIIMGLIMATNLQALFK